MVTLDEAKAIGEAIERKRQAIRNVVGEKTMDLVADAEYAMNVAFLEEFGDGDYDWSSKLTKEQREALSKISSAFMELMNPNP